MGIKSKTTVFLLYKYYDIFHLFSNFTILLNNQYYQNMKRITFILVLLFSITTSYAQEQKGFIGGSASLWNNKYEGNDMDFPVFTFAPTLGFNINKKAIIGATFLFTYQKLADYYNDSYGEIYKCFAFAPYFRYNYYEKGIIGFLGEIDMGVSKDDDYTGWELGIRPGIDIRINQHISVEATYGFLGYRNNYMRTQNGFGLALTTADLSIGFRYNF